ncbi:DUF3099 domain-containing protein [Microbacterium sp. SS28]|uniref:DUF3099 domain-containing protein n=1 Tax=Microbacterium sp. SS28 TaxID=2919948 RepID=UPI001FAB1890|nr:DUF3099 domain-containing protein [Microbacterium sp. SS28]
MKHSNGAQSATSLPQAPQDEVGARETRYLVTMGIRIACIILMIVITPYGWYTWVLAVGAVVLPYIAVVAANVGQDGRRVRREDPERALPATARVTSTVETPRVIRVEEQKPLPHEADGSAPAAKPDDAA